MKDLEQRCI